jgi:superfamily II DNA/RNA helicase
VDRIEQVDRLLHLVMEEKQAAENSGHTLPLTIVFVERKARCDEVADALCQEGIYAAALHGGRSQFEREAALRDFRQGKISILVATVCAPPPAPAAPHPAALHPLSVRLSSLDAGLLKHSICPCEAPASTRISSSTLFFHAKRMPPHVCCATTSGRARQGAMCVYNTRRIACRDAHRHDTRVVAS